MQIKEFQGIISQKYEKRDRERGIPATFLWFIEEVGELATANLSLRAWPQGVDSKDSEVISGVTAGSVQQFHPHFD